jgi:hypothetical protein|tara:strand:- start:352 stop:681 length:330 start_codon:yes stop_codon:yes gene_type:complete
MLTNTFAAVMTPEQLLTGESRHSSEEPSRRLAMAAGLTKSSEELQRAWQDDPSLYLTTLKAAYEDNKTIEELLVSSAARLVSAVDGGGGVVVDRAMEIVKDAVSTEHVS